MDATAAAHPNDQTLQSYGLGKLDDISSVSVSKHLESCPDCQRRVAELSSDSFLGRLRDAQGSPEMSAIGRSPVGGPNNERGPAIAFSPPPADTLPPELIDHPDYEIVRELGRGGMGVVYLAQNKLMGRPEVLKVVGRHLIERPGVLDRFLREIRSAAKLHHANIVSAYSALRLGESLVLAMEHVEGLDLAKMVKTKGPLPIAHACSFVHQAALGLQHAHERGMVHRDIKPANLMLAREGKKAVVKVLDFGLAKVTSEGQTDSGLTREGQMLGTPDYIAPEQIRDAQSADIRADIYSLGCTFYYLLTGEPPFGGEHLWDLYQAHFSMEAGPLNLVRPEVPVELAALVAKMMAKDPRRRFQTPGEVAQALLPFFKKGNVPGGGANTEFSRAGEVQAKQSTPGSASVPPPVIERAPAPLVDARKPAPTQPGSILEGLIDLGEREPLFDRMLDAVPAAAVPKPSQRAARPWSTAREKLRRPGPHARWAAAGALLLGFLAAWAVVLRVKTANGTIVLENVPESAVVEVDGDRITVTPTGGEPIKIEATAGKHGLVVRRGDLVLLVQSVTLEAGKQFKHTFTAQLERPVVERPESVHSPVTKQSSDDARPTSIDRSQFAKLSGQWHVEGDELVQTDATQSYSELSFGDNQWTDYDFTVDAMRVGGGNSFSLFFRSTDRNNEYDYAVSGDDNKPCSAEVREQGHASGLDRYDFCIRDRVWYTARVHVRGNHFVCSLYDNFSARDIRLFDFSDERHPTGRVGLQTFGSSVRFRKIKVTAPDGRVLWEGPPAIDATKPSEPAKLADKANPSLEGRDGFIQLFNGVDLTGWKTHPSQPGNWHVENGNLVGSGPAAVSHLYTVRDNYRDFHLRADVRINDAGNSGVCFRTPFGPPWPAYDPKYLPGYEAQIYSKPGDRAYTGSLFIGVEAVVPVNVPPVLPFDWFTLEVIARGNHVVVSVNGMTTADYTDVKRQFASGHIALQQYGPQAIVEFRKIEIKELDVAPSELKNVGRDGFVPLFNGKDLTGWVTPEDKSLFTVENGAIVGRTKTERLKKNEFLATEKSYGDFVLKAKVKIRNGNSGIQFRSKRQENGVVSGPQADVADDQWGLLYEERGRGMLERYPLDKASALLKDDGWNEFVITAKGQHVTIDLNGTRIIDRNDPMFDKEGIIALQVHVWPQPMEVRFKDIEAMDLSHASAAGRQKAQSGSAGFVKADPRTASDGFRPLFNGKDLRGWKTHPSQPQGWRVTRNMLSASGSGPSHLYTERGDFADFHLRLEARVSDRANSGVYVRGPFGPKRPANKPVFPDGYEAQINSTHWNADKTGSLRAGTAHAPVVLVSDSRIRPGEWFRMDLIVEGNRITVRVNDRTTADYVDQDQLYTRGHITLQWFDGAPNFGSGPAVEFRKIEIKELRSGAPAP